jgi:hypothetical protein
MKKLMGALFLILIMITSFIAYAQSNPPVPSRGNSTAKPESRSNNNDKNSDDNKHPSKGFPAIIEISKAPVIQVETADKNEKRSWSSSPEWWMVGFTGLLAAITCALALYTGKLYHATVNLGKSADAAGKQQMDGVQKSIAEAARAAAAMEHVAGQMRISASASTENVNVLKERTALQMRAYLSVSIGVGLYQDRLSDIKFEVKPTLANSGHTPAHKVSYWARAAVLPVPLPEDFQFPTMESEAQSYVLGPGQLFVINAIVDDYEPDTEVENIKHGIGKSPYIWGIVSYTDVFGDSHITKFCHSIYWVGPRENETINGYYAKKHNEAT